MATIEWNIEKALFDRVEALTEVPTSSMRFPGMVQDRPKTGAWLEVSVMPNKNTRLFLANDEPVWRMGILQVLVHWPIDNRGPKGLAELAGRVALHFPQSLVLTSADGLEIRVSETPSVMSAMPTEFSWARPVSVKYELNA